MAFLLIKDHLDANIIEIHADGTTLPRALSRQLYRARIGSQG
jgi:hypothetical protein